VRVIHVVLGKANPDRMNGVNKVVHNLATEQLDRGDEVEVWGITSDPEAATPSRRYGLRLFSSFLGRVFPPRSLVEAVAAVTPSTVLHLHGCFIPEFAAVSRLLQRRGLRYFVTTHGALAPIALRTSALAKRIYLRLLERRVLLRAAGVQVLGETEWKHARELLPGVRTFLVPNGARPSEVAFDGRPEESGTRPVFGFCGRIDWKHKGVDLLIEGFARYKAAGGRGELWLIGGGEDLDRTRALAARLAVADHVTFFGPLYGAPKLRRIAALDAFLHPSRSEGFPMSVLEAAALGRPLVVSAATNVGGYVRSFGAGIVLSHNTPDAIAAAMDVVAQSSGDTWEQAGRNAARMIAEELNWTRVAARLAEEYARP
jgi:glycosyltransferase involved in cell wall biosynthesis